MAAMPGSDRYDPGSIAPLDRLTWQGAIFAPRAAPGGAGRARTYLALPKGACARGAQRTV